jgi:DNA-binding XRE family transcriptional regulator
MVSPVRGREMMEQDDKVFAAALSIGSTLGFGPTATRNVRADGSVEVGTGGALELEEVVGSTSAMDTETPRGSSDTPAPGLTESSGDSGSVGPSGSAGKASEPSLAKPDDAKNPKKTNNVRKIRIERMMSKAELARRANLSVLTIDRVERGYGCRVDTKRKILEALGLSLADRVRVFGEEE